MSGFRFHTAAEAEDAFYRAFERRDIDAMMAVWDDADDVVCIHPLGSVLEGAPAIRASWQSIFKNAPAMRFTIEVCTSADGDEVAVRIVYEHIRVPGQPSQPPVLATNAFRRTEQGWRMILHHASPGEPLEPRPAALH